MSEIGHQFSTSAFMGFYSREGRQAHEPDVVRHAVFSDEFAGAVVDINTLKLAVKTGRDAVGVPLDVARYALKRVRKSCALDAKPPEQG